MQLGISITICTYNGVERISKAIFSIAKQKSLSSNDIELIIVDNASTDDTLQYCKLLLEEISFPFEIQLLVEIKSGAVHARNLALKKAKYKWLLICDDDNELEENYLANAISILSNNSKIGALGGRGIAMFNIEKPIWFDKYCSSYAVEKQNEVDGKIERFNASLYGAGTFFNAEILKKIYVSGFKNIMIGPDKHNLTRGEDTEWCYLLLLYKYEIWYSSKLIFKHHLTNNRLNWSYYLKLKKGIASGAGLLFGYHFLLNKNKHSNLLFLIQYSLQLFKQMFLYIKCFIKMSIVRNKETELGFEIISSKLKSFVNNFYTSFNSYKCLIKLIQY
jgi:glycosyltransferase involved in cell wall biosynthesis